jgi:hypothetical protein
MNALRVLYHMIRADFLERVRRYPFLVTLAAALYLAYAVATEKVWIVVGNGYRGVYNSAWIGMLMTICCSTFLSLVGFYIVKNSVLRDTDTRVGRILAATPMRKDFYALAKTLSNFAVLACMVGVLMLAAVAMQLLQGEARSISLWKLWAPFVLIALPAMLLPAALALLFETLPILRGGVGNVLYFFVWTAQLAIAAGAGWDDVNGMQLLYRSTRAALQAIDPTSPQNFHFSLTIGGQRAARTFLWNGIDWTPQILWVRVEWIAASLAIALLASVFFHRFDPAREWSRPKPQKPADAPPALPVQVPVTVFPANALTAIHLTPLLHTRARLRFPQLVSSELRLMLKGQRWWWYTVAAGLFIAELASPAEARPGLLLAAWLWPILVWSQMGCREARHATQSLIFSSERALSRQLPALWTAGVIVALLTGGGVAIRLILSADWQALLPWLVAALFIPSLALALGVSSGTSKTFEALYTVWWYMGPAHQMPQFDFMGLTPASSTPLLYLGFAAGLVAISYVGRRVRLGYA